MFNVLTINLNNCQATKQQNESPRNFRNYGITIRNKYLGITIRNSLPNRMKTLTKDKKVKVMRVGGWGGGWLCRIKCTRGEIIKIS